MIKNVLVIFIFFTTSCFSQQVRLRLEGGVNSGGLPKSYDLGKNDGRLKPLLRPAFGIHLVGETRFGMFADVNARFYSTGMRDIVTRNDTDRINNTWYRWREEQKFSFTRLAYGAGIGYKLPILKKKISIIAGYRKIYHSSGHYSYSNVYEDGLGNTHEIVKGYDPFDNPNLDIPARRNGHEFYFAATFDFTSRLGCMIQYSLPSYIGFTENQNGHTPWDWHGYATNDASVAVLYTIR